MTAPVFFKDPDATVDFPVDWSDYLDADTIASVVWTVPSGLSSVSTSNTTTSATIWLSGGTAGIDYAVGCKITTAGGRTDERTLIIRCRDNV